MDKIVNLTLLVIIAVCAWSGYKKGIVMGIGGIIVIVVSLYGANLLSNTFSYEVIPVLRPFVSGYMETQLRASVYLRLGIDPEVGSNYPLDELLATNPTIIHGVVSNSVRSLGIYANTADAIAQESEKYASDNDVSYHDALGEVMCVKISYAGGFIIGFLLILITLTVIGNLPNFSYELPEFDIVNNIVGTALGVITGLMFCFVTVWILKFAGKLIGENTLHSAGIASWLVRIDLVARFTGI